MPSGKTVVDDLVKGPVTFENATLPDPVILKSNGGPTYNFAAAVDDALMEISVVVRGDEHLPNTPVQMALQDALGLRSPRYAHVPLILNEEHQKLSKRHDTVSIEEFRELGIQPEAMIDHLALLGWSAPGGREEFTLTDLTELFSLERVHKAGAIFNEEPTACVQPACPAQAAAREVWGVAFRRDAAVGLRADAGVDRTLHRSVR